MKATLEFDLSDQDERQKHKRAIVADDLVEYIVEIAAYLRGIEKHGPPTDIRTIREVFYNSQPSAVQAAIESLK